MRTVFTLALVLAASGCSLGPDVSSRTDAGALADPDPETEVASGGLAQPDCVDGAETWRRVRAARRIAEGSVHELVTCGQAQMGVVNSMILIVLLSNDALFEPETVEELSELGGLFGLATDVPFDESPDGRWRMPINPGSTFDVQFFSPDAGPDAPALLGNVFDLETYLEGAHVATSLSWEEMKADFAAKNTYTLTWEGPGPLAHLLFPEGLPAEPRVEIELSLVDFAYLLGWGEDERPDFGPFLNLGALVIDSAVKLVDDRQGVVIDYAFAGARGRLMDLADAGRLGFELLGLNATEGDLRLVGEAGDLAYLSRGTLAGRLVYRVEGPMAPVRIVDDFGEGAGYPEAEAWCPEDWPPPEHADLGEPTVNDPGAPDPG